MKKNWMPLILGIVLIVCGAIWGLIARPAAMELGNSELFSSEEVEAAADMIAAQVDSWEGCKLYKVSFAGDSRCLRDLSYCQGLEEGKDIAECMVFEVRFRSPILNAGAFNPNQVYDWTWYLGRAEGGSWKMLTWGEA